MRGGRVPMIASALSSRRRRAVGVIVLRHPRIAWLQDAIAKAPKRVEPACDFRARHDQVGVDDVLPLQFPIVGLGEHKVGGNGRHRNHARSRSMTIKRDLKPGHGCHSHTHNREYIVTAKDVAPEVRIAAMPKPDWRDRGLLWAVWDLGWYLS